MAGKRSAQSWPLRVKQRTRAPSFTYLVRLAVKCQSAEELGQKLRRRYQRQQQRQGQTPPGPQPRRRAELAERLDRLLVQD